LSGRLEKWKVPAVKISIVVPAYNEAKLLRASLREIRAACRAFTERGWESELIVCDNNSTDRTAELARLEQAQVVFEPVNQIGRARNRGAEAATGDWLIFVDADSFPSPALFADVAETIRSGHCLAGGSTVRLDQPSLVGGALVQFWNVISRTFRWAAGSFIFCQASAFREAGGFSPDLFASEEVDLSRRLRKLARARGQRLCILHRHPLTTSARKLHLYSAGEHLRFWLGAVLRPKQTIRSRAACANWYDGRR
jgi:glycosyltransferase involved in cell wall biosynthesis